LSCVRIQVEATAESGRGEVRLWRHDGLRCALAIAQRGRWQRDGGRTAAGGFGVTGANDDAEVADIAGGASGASAVSGVSEAGAVSGASGFSAVGGASAVSGP